MANIHKEKESAAAGKRAHETGTGQGQAPAVTSRATSAPLAPASQPFAFMRRFAEDMDRLFEDFGFGHGVHIPALVSRGRERFQRESGLGSADWSPHVDVLEDPTQFIVRVDLPGLNKDEIQVEVAEDVLTIRGERKHQEESQHEGYYYREREQGCFCRMIPLPEGVDPQTVEASFRDGVLQVRLPTPKQPAKQAHPIEIH